MADLKDTELTPVPTEVPASNRHLTLRKRRRSQESNRAAGGAVRTSAIPSSAQASSRSGRYPCGAVSSEDLLCKKAGPKLGDIESQTGRGSSLKDAVKKAGISEQTYYHWKKAAAQVPQSDELKDLVKLEEENTRLEATSCRAAAQGNADLRKKLGLG